MLTLFSVIFILVDIYFIVKMEKLKYPVEIRKKDPIEEFLNYPGFPLEYRNRCRELLKDPSVLENFQKELERLKSLSENDLEPMELIELNNERFTACLFMNHFHLAFIPYLLAKFFL